MAGTPAQGCTALPIPCAGREVCSTGDPCPCRRRGREAVARACTLRCTEGEAPEARAAGAQAGGSGRWDGGGGSEGDHGAESAVTGEIGAARVVVVAAGARAPARGLGGASAPPRRGSGKKCGLILHFISKTLPESLKVWGLQVFGRNL